MATINTDTVKTDFIGNPITYKVTSAQIVKKGATPADADYVETETADDVIAFHRLCVDVISGDTTIHMATSVSTTEAETVSFDVSSALRAFFDEDSYSPTTLSQGSVSYTIEAYDEYSENGTTKTTTVAATSGTAYGGKLSDLERLKNSSGKSMSDFCCSRKPTTTPELVCVGEKIAYVGITGQTSEEEPVESTDLGTTLTLGGKSFYVYADTIPDNRYQFRFINGLGALESIGITARRETEVNITQNTYAIKAAETYSEFTRGITRKSQDYETWKMSSGPVDKAWQSWFLHEFLMAEHVWINISDTWVRCHIIPEDTVSGYSNKSKDFLEVQFSVKMDINGALQ